MFLIFLQNIIQKISFSPPLLEIKLADRVYINFESKPDLLLNLIYPFQLSSYRICLMYKDDN